MSRWSLRTKLIIVAALGLLPILLLTAWQEYEKKSEQQALRSASLGWALELASSRQRELIEGSQRLLAGVCGEDVVQRSADPGATSADVRRCENYLAGVLSKFPGEYSAFVITDSQGVTRCSSSPAAVGTSLADRKIFRQMRTADGVSVGSSIASRITPTTVIPIATPIYGDEVFRGMCAVGISLNGFAEFITAVAPRAGTSVALIDAGGAPVGGNPQATLALPVTMRLAQAIEAKQQGFVDYGQNGLLHEYRIRPLRSEAIFMVAAAPLPQGLLSLWHDWSELALVSLAGAVLLLAVGLGAERWCLRPLRYLEATAARIARGEEVKIEPAASWGKEVISVGAGIEATATALASREAELKSGLEQRDHMLREIHHRVKNNLQMISSLLNLQAGEIRSPRIRRYFGDAQNRVLTLSILHRHLYERSSWSLVDFQQFISDLVRQISVGRSGLDRPSPRFHIRAPIMAVGPDTAIPVGLIVTEAVSNALNHDFSAVAGPEIRIDAAEGPDHTVELVIEDNGRRTLRETIGSESRGGFGLTLVRGLAMQLGGEAMVSTTDSGGMRLMVRFPLAMEQAGDG
jgi:two-component sensor histidine kinase